MKTYPNNSSVFYDLKSRKYKIANLKNHNTGKPAATEFSFYPERNSGRMPVVDDCDARLTACAMPFGYFTVADLVEGPDHPWTKDKMRVYITEALLNAKQKVESARVLGFLMEYREFPQFMHNLLAKSVLYVKNSGPGTERAHFTKVADGLQPDVIGKFAAPPRPY